MREVYQISSTKASIIFHWQVEGENISHIVITSSPALPCGSQCEVGGEETELKQTVELGVEYNITVTVENSCGGSESNSINLLLNGR